ncbi:biotin/lipoyl-binding protein [Acidovorax sp. Be4]|uniref:Biotin/lipoyl-binding protein n=1 Tax=Acidovorax bellezanensis TaxID=2976702 RepID=A0ABT2PKW2_9BURK|nr:biotin carboxylase N-terminal domain-containing protein [Acidovorax sp. Be4]MCT9811116.1 biotin/lipoyl-binding protein [Acidovorax sp. Be4]
MTVTKNIRPFRCVLIANRGEIALRIIQTARQLGYRTVAIYSEADRLSPHVQAADSAVLVGGPLPRDSYLDSDAILAAARLSGADAIHPGYGFLAENADFANAVDAAGLVFIGPTGAAMQAMGNKARAKQLMMAADMPCIPGYQEADQADSAFVAAAARIDFPVMVKAAAGGGGRGMRLVHSPADLPAALASARSEAQQAFGSAELILEKAILAPRHIEIQLLADSQGHCIYLGERDCSIQRRHQKVIEEAPSTVVTPALRQRMGEAAVKAAQAIGYIGAGTMEFLLDTQGHFYFMEMNTRLQVEHAVTEAITGLDLVAWQFRIAAGEPLSLQQADVHYQGHAIEARLTAEDVYAGFLPQTGNVLFWRAPNAPPPGPLSSHQQALDVRVDHALRDGWVISPYYDSMIAKVVAHGATREEARRKLVQALEQCVLLGVPTNQRFLVECLNSAQFAAGREIHTGFVAQTMAHSLAQAPAPQERTVAYAVLARLLASQGLAELGAGRLQQQTATALELRHGQQRWQAQVQATAQGWDIALQTQTGEDAATAAARFEMRDLLWLDAGRRQFQVQCNGMVESAAAVATGLQLDLFHAGQAWHFEQTDAHKSGQASQDGGVITAPLTGRVVAVAVKEGDTVSAGQRIAVLEAMKMEHTLHAPIAGRVVELRTMAGQQAAKGALLLRIEELA